MTESNSAGGKGGSRSPVMWAAAAVVVVVVVVSVGGYVAVREAGPPAVPEARSIDGAEIVELIDEPGADQHTASPQLRVTAGLDGVVPVGSGDVIHVDLAEIGTVEAVRFEFTLPMASADEEPRPVTVYDPEGQRSKFETAALSGERTQARIDVPSSTFTGPGKYIVEIRTTERSHIPLVRFAVEIH